MVESHNSKQEIQQTQHSSSNSLSKRYYKHKNSKTTTLTEAHNFKTVCGAHM